MGPLSRSRRWAASWTGLQVEYHGWIRGSRFHPSSSPVCWTTGPSSISASARRYSGNRSRGTITSSQRPPACIAPIHQRRNYRRRTSSRCQRSNVSGLIRRDLQAERGGMRLKALRSRRSVGWKQGRWTWRSRTRSWWRRARTPRSQVRLPSSGGGQGGRAGSGRWSRGGPGSWAGIVATGSERMSPLPRVRRSLEAE